MKYIPKIVAMIIVLSFGITPFAKAQFFTNGSAVATNDSCYQLTTSANNQAGSVWNGEKINLNESFDVVVEILLGCKDQNGADGIVFGLQPVSTSIGVGGGQLGFGGVVPSLGVEFDTYQNINIQDPVYDHIAVVKNGNLSHLEIDGNTLAGPVQASVSNTNIEDCEYHPLRINWNAETQTMDVFFDCTLRISYVGDIVNDVFNGDPLVYWGFTAGTGSFNNVQEICFSYTSFLDQLEDKILCPGGALHLEVNGGIDYQWSPSDGLSQANIPNPIASPSETTLYTVEVKDACDIPFFDDILIEVAGDSVFFDLGADTTLCEGSELLLDVTTPTAIYEWSTAETSSQIIVNSLGIYTVTVTRTDTFCIAEDQILIDFLPKPQLDLGPDTSLCFGQQVVLHAFFEQANYLWQNGSKVDSLIVKEAGLYSLVLDHFCGTLSDQIEIMYEDCQKIYLPNAFSPNFDGINDLFFPQDGGDVVLIHSFQIFDRWGNLVYTNENFSPNESNQGWNGKTKGKPAEQGTYVWIMEVSFINNATIQLGGDVQLLR